MSQTNFRSNTKSGRKNIFISYRVSDTAGETGRLVDSLKQHFYEDQIFMDIDKIEPGVDFTKVISHSLEACDVMLVVVGPNWLGRNSDGSTRMSKANDWVRLEVATALKRDIRVVPLLTDNATLPDAEDLPEDLHPLLTRQAFELSNKRWKYDTGQLVEFLKQVVGIQPKPIKPAEIKERKSNTAFWLFAAISLLIILFIILAIVYNKEEGTQTRQEEIGKVNKQEEIDKVKEQPQNVGGEETILEQKKPVEEPEQSPGFGDVEGVWDDANGLYYLYINQNGKKFTIQSYSYQGQLTGEGNGYMDGNDFYANINILAVGMVTMESKLSSGGNILQGKTSITANGSTLSEPLMLNKRNNATP